MAAIYKNKSSRFEVVPWYEKKEWEETYQQAFSGDPELQEKAYTQMCIWKTRYPNLPLGVECTMSVLHVRLCDRQTEGADDTAATTYQHRDLQLLYSTAVMRFLNHLTAMSNCKNSMYKMAEQNRIPDWLINLRHEAAHGNSVPALYLLRQASDIILQWLRENYWEMEAEPMTNHVSDREEKRQIYCKRITELLEMWVVLKVNYWAQNRTIDKIPDEDIRNRAMELANEEGIGIKYSAGLETVDRPTKLYDYNETIDEEEEMDLGEGGTGNYTHKIKTAFEPLIRRLFFPLKRKPYIKSFYQDCLIDCLVKFESFCPQIDQNNLTETELSQLTWLLCHLWREVLVGLQTHRMLHSLLSSLGPSDYVWLRLFSLLLSGDPPPPPPLRGSEDVCLLLAEKLPCRVDPQVLVRRMRIKKSPYDLRPPTAQDIQVLQDLAHNVVYKPTPLTSVVCRKTHLLRFWENGLRPESVAMLADLTEIYNGTQPRKGKPLEKVYTLASLLDQGLVISDSEEDNGQLPDSSPWTLYSGEADWSRCALGTVPWQSS